MSPVIAPAPTALAPMSRTSEFEMLPLSVSPVESEALPLMNPLFVLETLVAVVKTNSVRDQFPEFWTAANVVEPMIIWRLPFAKTRSPKDVAPFSKMF